MDLAGRARWGDSKEWRGKGGWTELGNPKGEESSTSSDKNKLGLLMAWSLTRTGAANDKDEGWRGDGQISTSLGTVGGGMSSTEEGVVEIVGKWNSKIIDLDIVLEQRGDREQIWVFWSTDMISIAKNNSIKERFNYERWRLWNKVAGRKGIGSN